MLALAVIGVLVTVLGAFIVLGAAVAARQQAQLAADLGAVAGAQSLRSGAGPGEVCDRASQFVRDNAADLDECTVQSAGTSNGAPDVVIKASVRLSVGPGWTARASARAGLVHP